MDIKLLHVDDEEVFLELTKIYIEQKTDKIHIVSTESVDSALELIITESFDIVVSDYLMKNCDGLKFLKILREEKHLTTPFILFTGKGREEVAIEALNLGANRYIQKGDPVSFDILIHAINTVVDHYRVEQELKKMQERLDFAIKGAYLGLWDWDIRTGKTYLNDIWANMLGYTLEEIEQNVDIWKKLVHPDDKHYVDAKIEEHLQGKTNIYRTERRLKTKSGDYKWVLDMGKVVERDEHGTALRVIGIQMDIDEQKNIEAQLKISVERYKNILLNSKHCLFILSKDGKWLDVNDKTIFLLGCGSKEELLQTTIDDFYYSIDDKNMYLTQLKKLQLETFTEFPVKIKRRNGCVLPAFITLTSVIMENGITEIIGTIRKMK